ncbi:MAG: Flp family type IVb pilin [bacterium]|nr:Flp family type IVb pilin [bacterium]
MDALKESARRFLRGEDGPTATEYAVMFAMIILAAVGSISALGPSVAARLVIPGW